MILVIGAGIAGLSAARAACAAGSGVTLVTSGTLALGDACSTAMAQGGIAAAIGEGDRPLDHLTDTVAAGAGLVDVEAARVLVGHGADDVRRLLAEGFAADRGPSGAPMLGLEGAHGAHRIVHAGGDRTGAVLQQHLVAQLPAGVRVIERAGLGSLLVDSGVAVGAVVTHDTGESETVRASAVVLATGGYAALYDRTSNHAGARGAGIVAAAEAGALVADLEFVQFHPTVLAGTGQLISEAVRGAGAVLLDATGARLMVGRHPLADLASRDVVSREIHRELRDTGAAAVWLDASLIEREQGPGSLARMFPGIDSAMHTHGFDWAVDPVPVAPAAHYTMGGVASDLDGRTSVPGLFVAGEAAATGVHGANRLASNSLLEGLVFGRRAGTAAASHLSDGDWAYAGEAMPRLERSAAVWHASKAVDGAADGTVRLQESTGAAVSSAAGHAVSVGQILSRHLGIERDRAGIAAAQTQLAPMLGRDARLAELIAYAALTRTESRGGHLRADVPRTDPAQAKRRALKLGAITAPSPQQPDPARRSLAPC